jgi:hypothetical protein
LQKRSRRGKTSRFLGVHRIADAEARPWMALVAVGGRRFYVGAYETEHLAAVAYDRVALHFGATKRNFPRRRLKPARPEELRAEIKKRAGRTSRFRGVHHSEKGAARPWVAMIGVGGTRQTNLGAWATEKQAAEAYDRAALHFGKPQQNFPHRRLEPASPAALRAEAGRLAKKTVGSSRYWGVWPFGRRWQATIRIGEQFESAGRWNSEEAAAVAYDRAARYQLGDAARLNFPKRRLEPLAPVRLRALARAARKTTVATSEYRGVYLASPDSSQPWAAQMTFEDDRTARLGRWATEKDAARAYDRAARMFLGARAELNLPDEDLEPATPATLLAEARRERKRGTSSRYLGVTRSASGVWIAKIHGRGKPMHLGRFVNERAAAEAYDEKAIELRGTRARVNFHPETGKPVWGKRLSDLAREASGR